MSNEQVKVVSSGPGFCGLLAILFIGLKLGHVIAWPWLWVLSPLWVPFLIAVALLLAIGVGYLLYLFFTK